MHQRIKAISDFKTLNTIITQAPSTVATRMRVRLHARWKHIDHYAFLNDNASVHTRHRVKTLYSHDYYMCESKTRAPTSLSGISAIRIPKHTARRSIWFIWFIRYEIAVSELTWVHVCLMWMFSFSARMKVRTDSFICAVTTTVLVSVGTV